MRNTRCKANAAEQKNELRRSHFRIVAASDLRDGRVSRIPVNPSIKKHSSSVFRKIMVHSRHPALPKGAYRDRHERWVGCGGREQRD